MCASPPLSYPQAVDSTLVICFLFLNKIFGGICFIPLMYTSTFLKDESVLICVS